MGFRVFEENLMGLGQKEDKIKDMGEKKGICYEVLLCCQNGKLD